MKKAFLLVTSLLVLVSCNNSPQQPQSEDQSKAASQTQEKHHFNESSEDLELNDGERWIVNQEMKPFVLSQEELLAAYQDGELSDHKDLASQLQEQNQLLIQSCTMTGKSHDELHKWLHPYMSLLVDLGKAPTSQQAEKLVQEVDHSFQIYHSHFK